MGENTDNSDKWTCERFVAFLDIMGFKDRIIRETPVDIINMFESLKPATEMIDELEKTAKKENKAKAKSEIPFLSRISFSDSIILFSPDKSLVSILLTIAFVQYILFIAIQKGIPMKGAIAYGLFTADKIKSIYFGMPLIDAYELQKELKLYGAVIHHTAERELLPYLNDRFHISSMLCKYQAPTKSGMITHYFVDWTQRFPNKEETIQSVNDLYLNVSGEPRLYVDNTLEFVREMQKRKAELAQKKKS